MRAMSLASVPLLTKYATLRLLSSGNFDVSSFA